MIIWGLALLIVGICFIVFYSNQNRANKRRTANVTGTCVNVEEKTTLSEESDNSIRHYTFTYNVEGKEYSTKPLHSIPEDPKVGEQVTLRYNPKNPADAGYDYKSDDKTKIILWIGLGLILISIILIIL